MLLLADDQIQATLEKARDALQVGQKKVFDALGDSEGPHALPFHVTHVIERIGDVRVLFERLLAGRTALSETSGTIERSGKGRDYDAMSNGIDDFAKLQVGMRIDFESVFHFGAILLDQWSYVVAYLSARPAPEQFEFHDLVLDLEKDADGAVLDALRGSLIGSARWLHYWMRSYRNHFVVHADRPVQRGTVAKAYGNDFLLFTPSPPGWHDDAQLDREIEAFAAHAPKWKMRVATSSVPVDRRALLEEVVGNVGSISSQAERDKIAALARKKGLSTPTFQVLVSVLADFVHKGSTHAFDAALKDPPKINLGRAPSKGPS